MQDIRGIAMKRIFEGYKAFFNNRSNRKFLFHYGVVILVIFTFSICSFFAVGTHILEYFNESNQMMVNTLSQSLNHVFKKMDDVSKNLLEIYSYSNMSEDQESAVEKNRIVGQLEELILGNEFVEEIVFMDKSQDYIVTSQGYADKRDFFENKYSNEQYNLQFFQLIQSDSYTMKVLPSAYYKNLVKYPSEDPHKLITFVQSVPASDANILIFVSEERFLKHTNLEQITGKMSFRIFDQNDNLIFSNTTGNYQINTGNVPAEYTEEVIEDGANLLYIKKSDYNHFYYIAEIQNYVYSGMWIGSILLFLGLLASFLFAVWRIQKQGKVLAAVYQELSIEEKESGLDLLLQPIRSIKEKIREKDENIEIMKQEIQNSLFAKLIHSSSYYTKHKKAVEMAFETIAAREKFLILSIDTIKDNSDFQKYEREAFQQKFSDMGIKNIMLEEKGNRFLFILGMYETASVDLLTEEIGKVAKEVRKKDIDILVSLSKEFPTLAGIYDAYADIAICRDYRGINDKESILTTKDIRYGSFLYIPLNFKDEFSTKMMTKDEQGLKEYCREIFHINLKNNVPITKFEFLLRNMENAVIEVLSTNQKRKSELFELEQMFLSKLGQLRENHDPEGVINSFYNLLHLSIGMFESKKNTLNRADVIKYINTNYYEDLYLEKIAAVFETTSKYFSNYFKKEFSIGFNEYLTQIRVSHAKELLLENGLSLAEIGEKVGYLNQATFAAAFKKNVGVPPGKYREMNKGTKK